MYLKALEIPKISPNPCRTQCFGHMICKITPLLHHLNKELAQENLPRLIEATYIFCLFIRMLLIIKQHCCKQAESVTGASVSALISFDTLGVTRKKNPSESRKSGSEGHYEMGQVREIIPFLPLFFCHKFCIVFLAKKGELPCDCRITLLHISSRKCTFKSPRVHHRKKYS